MLLIAYPDKDVETQFEFEYYEAQYVYVNQTKLREEQLKQQMILQQQRTKNTVIALSVCFILLSVAIALLLSYLRKRKLIKIKPCLDDPDGSDVATADDLIVAFEED